ncbi:MAG: NAD(P)H-hydrate dehydratase [Candidatus Micrarchaeia archaeon]
MQSLKELSIYTKKVITARDTYALSATAEAIGLSRTMLAENAGAKIAAELLRNHKNQRILVVSGSGHKGAIGMSVARHLFEYVNHISVALLYKPEELKKEASKLNYNILSKFAEIAIIGDSEELKPLLKEADVVVDAIVGVGLRGRLDKRIASIINMINKSGKYIASIDIPSGVDPDTGMPNVASIRADMLYTLYKEKPFSVTRAYAQNVSVVDLGVPYGIELITGPGDVMLATEPRLLSANKYTNGSVLVVGGSPDYKGAPVLAAHGALNALSALYSGAGYATVAMPSSVVGRVSIPPNLIVRSFGGDTLSKTSIPKLEEIRHDVAILGPGLSTDKESMDSIVALVKSETSKGKFVILDATAIKAVASSKGVLGKKTIITPHDGEFGYLIGTSLKAATLEKRINLAVEFAKSYNCVVVLKGHETVITDGNLLKINVADTPVLATMGTGDVLAGIIASYLSLHMQPFESAVAGVYVHSKIGDAAFREMGLHITASDIISRIPEVLKQFDTIR